jgi:hypothetical protein
MGLNDFGRIYFFYTRALPIMQNTDRMIGIQRQVVISSKDAAVTS